MQRLAARAYLKASYEVEDQGVIDAYRSKAGNALGMQEGVKLSHIEADLKKEIAEGDAYYAQIKADEAAWAEAGEDLDLLFTEKYYEDATSFGSPRLGQANTQARDRFIFAAIGLAIIVAVGALASSVVQARKKNSA